MPRSREIEGCGGLCVCVGMAESRISIHVHWNCTIHDWEDPRGNGREEWIESKIGMGHGMIRDGA